MKVQLAHAERRVFKPPRAAETTNSRNITLLYCTWGAEISLKPAVVTTWFGVGIVSVKVTGYMQLYSLVHINRMKNTSKIQSSSTAVRYCTKLHQVYMLV